MGCRAPLVRYRRVAFAACGLALCGCGSAFASTGHAFVAREVSAPHPKLAPSDTASTTTSTPTVTTTTTTAPPFDTRSGTLQLARSIDGSISPKSVASTPTGLVFAQNMMYRHTITVYRSDGELLATIADAVTGALLGRPEPSTMFRGAPVEAAASLDGRYVYVSNYSMYGPGFGPEGTDTCRPGQYDDSYVYRVDVATLAIDRAYAVGAVPKYLAETADQRHLVVADWCSYDLTVIDLTDREPPRRVPLAAYPRGIAITHDATTAYIAVMGTRNVARVDLTNGDVHWIRNVGNAPRHVVLSPDDRTLYITLNADDTVVKLDTTAETITATAHVGPTPRSMAISNDGHSLYVVNYDGDTLTKLDADDLSVRQRVTTHTNPIGVTVNARTGDVWIACYSGHIEIYTDR